VFTALAIVVAGSAERQVHGQGRILSIVPTT
jgi:hypothetical protein